MYSVTIRDHIMISHSLKGERFGKAQQSHGATLILDITFFADVLNENNLVIDINYAKKMVQRVLSSYNYQNLDQMEEFSSDITTIEFLAKYFFDLLCSELINSNLEERLRNIKQIKVKIKESHLAWASFKGNVDM